MNSHKVMKNKHNTGSDPEVGMEPAPKSPSRPKSPSTSDGAKSPFECLSRIFRPFDLNQTTTQQKAFVLLGVAGAILDPLFFYILMINMASKCMKSDRKLAASAISLRSLVDALHSLLWRWCYPGKWKTEKSKPAATVPAATSAVAASAASTTTSSEEKMEISQGNSNSMSPRNSKATDLGIEILSVLPLPQAATLAILIIQGSPRSQQPVTLLKFSVLVQFIIRIFRVIPSFQEASTNSFTLLKSRFWICAGFNLLLFVIASHVLGAFWYLLSVGRLMDCWKSACRRRGGCHIDSLYCGGSMDNKSYLDHSCPIQPATNSSTFNFGIYLDALESNIVGSTRFPLKLSYCFWWGLRNLSSLGQNLEASAYEWEILFSICFSVLGLFLFSFFIGNMQAIFQYKTNKDLERMTDKIDKINKKQRELLKWEPFQWLPKDLQEQIILCMNERWLETIEVNLQTMMNCLPEGLDKRVKASIFSKLEKKMRRLLRGLNVQTLDMINCVKPVVFAEGSLVLTKGQPIDKMVFILTGKLTKQTGTDGSTPQELRAWDFIGQELLEDIESDLKVTPSTADVQACTKVEAFILDTGNLQYLVNQFKKTIKDKKVPIEEPKTSRVAATQMQKKAAGETLGQKIRPTSKKAGQSAAIFQYRAKKDLERMTDKMAKIKKRQIELLKWEPFQWLPKDLQEEIIFCTNDRWLETIEVNLRTMINYLPKGLDKRFKESIFSKLEEKVRLFRVLDMRALDEINCVKPEVFAEGRLVFEKGQPIDKMVFVLDGKLTKQNGSDRSTAQDLQAWDFCGEELLIYNSLKDRSSRTAPTWTMDIKACTKVEAFILNASDLQNLSKDSNELLISIFEHKREMGDAIKKQTKKAEGKPTGLTTSASFKESSTVGGTP